MYIPFLYVSITTSLWSLNFLKILIPFSDFRFKAIDFFPWPKESIA